MHSDFKDILIANGIDYLDVLDRFDGNSALYERLLFKYLKDPHLVNLQRALEEHDTETAYLEAHTLKGVAGNLSCTRLKALAAEASDALKQGDSGAAMSLMPALETEHQRIISLLTTLQSKTH